MRIKTLGLLMLMGLVALGSQVALGDNSGTNRSHRRTKTKMVDKQARAEAHRIKMLRERYAPISTMSSSILVTVQDEKTGKQATIVCDHEWWARTNKRVKHAELSQTAYEDLMISHTDKPFIVDGDFFAKCQKLTAPEPSAALRALSMDDIAEKYLCEIPRSKKYWTIKDGVDMDRAFCRLLLEKGCVLNSNCLDGSPMISW